MAVSQARLFRIYTRNLKIETHVRPNARFCPIVEMLGRVTNQNYGVYICRKPKERPHAKSAHGEAKRCSARASVLFSSVLEAFIREQLFGKERKSSREIKIRRVEAIDPLDQSLRQSNHADREETR